MKKLSLLTLLAISLTACESINTALETANSVLETTNSVLGANSSSSKSSAKGRKVFARIPDKTTKEYEIKNFVIYRGATIEGWKSQGIPDKIEYEASGEVYNKSNMYATDLRISIPAYDPQGFNCGVVHIKSDRIMDKGEKARIIADYPMNKINNDCKLDISKMDISFGSLTPYRK